MSPHARGRPRLGWLDRFIVPRETPLVSSRWHQHVVQRRVSRLDHLRPHRLNWDALKHPEPAAPPGEADEPLTLDAGDRVVETLVVRAGTFPAS